MDDRVARVLLEDNILVRQKRAEADIALLQKLATNPSVVLEELPIPGETFPPASNALHWQNTFLFDEFVGGDESILSGPVGELNWKMSTDAAVYTWGGSLVSPLEHYGIVGVTNASGTDAFVRLGFMISLTVYLMQFVVAFEPMADAGDGCVFGLLDTTTYEIDGTSKGIYFRREYTETNWHAVTTDGVGTTDTDTGVAFADAVWYLFEIKQPITGTLEFYINQILVATHTTNISTGDALYPIFGMKDPGSTAIFDAYLDYFSMQLAPIVQRWD